MKIVPVVCFVLAAAAATSMLPVARGYAADYPNQAQNCSATGVGLSNEGVGDCKNNRGLRGFAASAARHAQNDAPGGLKSVSAGHFGSVGHSGGRK